MHMHMQELRTKNYTVRTDGPTPGTLALTGDSRASLSLHIVAWVDLLLLLLLLAHAQCVLFFV